MNAQPNDELKTQLELLFPDQPDVVTRIMNVAKSVAALSKMQAKTLATFTRIDVDTAGALVDWAQAQVAAMAVDINVQVTNTQAASIPQHGSRIREFARRATNIVIDPETLQRLSEFAVAFAPFGPEVARLDQFVLDALVNKKAGAYITDDRVVRIADAYRTNKGKAAIMQLPTSSGLKTLELVPEDSRVEYWAEMNKGLIKSGFYDWIEQLAIWARTVGNSRALGRYAQVTAGLSEDRQEPKKLKQLHERVISNLGRLMEDRTRKLTSERISAEYDEVVLLLMENADFLYKLCNPPQRADPVDFFWNTDQLDLTLERQGLSFGDLVVKAIEALAQYDPNVAYEDQFEKFMEPANDLFTLMEEMGQQLPRRYNLQPMQAVGITGIAATFMAAIQIRVKVGGTEVTVSAQVAVAPVSIVWTLQKRMDYSKPVLDAMLEMFPSSDALNGLIKSTFNVNPEGVASASTVNIGTRIDHFLTWVSSGGREGELKDALQPYIGTNVRVQQILIQGGVIRIDK